MGALMLLLRCLFLLILLSFFWLYFELISAGSLVCLQFFLLCAGRYWDVVLLLLLLASWRLQW
jgi:hypothetical protein